MLTDCRYDMFADSSQNVTTAAVYLRIENEEQCNVSLIAAKTYLLFKSEMSRGSMPRKESIALDLGARLLRECLDSTTLPITNYEIWSDSQTAIQWCSERTLEL